ncbi:phenazine biosynthesis protein PhzF family [Halobacillus aidingensis]|uniref:Phenazine biosynthesis protein PhzF family n=1 Tax=Halobacillus aidingensis TaxID=240303 RepID=A0A1H0UC27_HALAD|nr:phenazine biosynthesis protein PhzF family [Halobacillus aidingensis]
MEDNFYLINAFTKDPFKGNPAAIVLLNEEKSDEWLKSYAQEINQPITTFVKKDQEGYNLRWFTPTSEIALCGHGTLGAANILFEECCVNSSIIQFNTEAGTLYAEQTANKIKLTFKIKTADTIEPADHFKYLINYPIRQLAWAEDRYIIELGSETEVKNAIPDMEKIKELDGIGLVITSRSHEPFDFVSRYFAPKVGIGEDYVTGSAHCALASYWKDIFKKERFLAFQDSPRGGEIEMNIKGDNVELMGDCVTLIKGNLHRIVIT